MAYNKGGGDTKESKAFLVQGNARVSLATSDSELTVTPPPNTLAKRARPPQHSQENEIVTTARHAQKRSLWRPKSSALEGTHPSRAKKGQVAAAAQKAQLATKQVAQPRITYLKVADIATFLSLLCGVLAFVFSLDGRLILAGVLLILCLVFDGLDGKIARLMNQQSEFGMYLDSLVDAVVFGMVPAAIALVLVPRTPLLVATAAVFVAAGVFRLARFQFTRLNGEFQGMPITVNGVLFGLILILVPQRAFAWVLPGYFVFSAVLMASTFRVRKL